MTQYKDKNAYIFPLKGVWIACNNYDTFDHRLCWSQEFAIDFIQTNADGKMFSTPKPASADYPCYRKEILAIADGEVVDCCNEMPENPAGLGSRLPKEEWNALMAKHGFVAGVAGNYVILKHAGGEYSFYAHFVTGTVTVKKGDSVKQGQLLGLVGNSGNSDAPHLHFHLMDGPSILTGRGLPCQFTNLKDVTGEPLPFITENNSIVHTE